ncbi:NAC domain containing protein [Melia azedarach]|uniref:NAC domain containing protein n=1 Tax=Melia azedarach TaxID=155640 RepID=A0ACC1XDY7_MELAZ|nr:NAC domain containing protein [Melia azedarach]
MEMEMETDSLVGFRFKPTDEEIIFLLKMKRLDPDFSVQTIKEIDFYNFDPWELPRFSGIQIKEPVWYYFYRPSSYKLSKSKSSERRKTKSGYWKITGRGSYLKTRISKDVIGRKKILSFCPRGSISKKTKPEWIMHEIRTKDDPLYKEDFVVCRLERRRDKKSSISTSNDSESSQEHMVVVQDASPESVLPTYRPFSNRNHVAEKTWELQLLSNQCRNGYDDLDIEFLPELHSPTCPEPGWLHSNSPINGCDLLNSHYDREPVNDPINSQRAFQIQNVSGFGGTGQTLSPEFNSSKSDGGICTEDEDEMGAETIDAWVKSLLVN